MAILCKQCSAPLPVTGAVGGLVTCRFCDSTQPLPREVTHAKGRPFSTLDFRDPKTPGWRGTTHFTYEFGGTPPEMRARIEDGTSQAYTALKTQGIFDDLDLAVTIRFDEGDPGDKKRYGIRAGFALRTQPGKQSCYMFSITNDGYYKAGVIVPKEDSDAFKYEALVKWTRYDGLDTTWGQPNRLRVVANGSRFQIYLNDQLATSFRDERYTQGLVELLVNPVGCPSEVCFSNLVMAHP